MAENISLNNVATFQNDTSAVNTVNSNNAAITTAFTDVLSRSGISPNQMGSTLDMNGNQIINLPFPTTLNSPARLVDVTNAQNISIVNATTGTSGHTVPFLDGTNTWSAPQTITLNSLGVNSGLTLNETVSGTTGIDLNINVINISDNVNAGAAEIYALAIEDSFGSSTAKGARVGFGSFLNLTSATSATNTNRAYTSIFGSSTASSSDNGTGVTSGTGAGQIQGGVFLGQAFAPATNLLGVNGAAFQTNMVSGSSVWAKSLIQAFSNSGDSVNGSGINAMLWLFNQTGSTAKWTNAILVDNQGGLGTFPLSASGTVLKTNGGSAANGIDFTGTAFSNTTFASSGFSVGPSGAIQSGNPTISNGQISLNGITSGFMSFSVNALGNTLNAQSSTNSSNILIGNVGTSAGSLTLAGLTSGSAVISCSATAGSLQLGGGNLIVDNAGNLFTNSSIRVGTSTAPIAGGDVNHAYTMSNTSGFGIYYGSGAPTITAAQGSLYLNTTGATNVTRAYLNTTGSNVWTAINTVA